MKVCTCGCKAVSFDDGAEAATYLAQGEYVHAWKLMPGRVADDEAEFLRALAVDFIAEGHKEHLPAGRRAVFTVGSDDETGELFIVIGHQSIERGDVALTIAYEADQGLLTVGLLQAAGALERAQPPKWVH